MLHIYTLCYAAYDALVMLFDVILIFVQLSDWLCNVYVSILEQWLLKLEAVFTYTIPELYDYSHMRNSRSVSKKIVFTHCVVLSLCEFKIVVFFLFAPLKICCAIAIFLHLNISFVLSILRCTFFPEILVVHIATVANYWLIIVIMENYYALLPYLYF